MPFESKKENIYTANVHRLFDNLRGHALYPHYSASLVAWVAAWLYLKWADVEDRERQAIAEFDGEEYESLFSKDLLSWICEMDPGEMGFHVEENLLCELHRPSSNQLLKDLQQMFSWDLIDRHYRPLFENRHMWYWLSECLHKIDFTSSEGLTEASGLLDAMIETTVKQARSAEFYTPKPVVELMVELADPKPGERIYDPCFGSGGFLVESARRIKEASKTCAAGEWQRIQQESIFGVEINALAYVIAKARIVLAGIPEPGLELGDTLLREKDSNQGRFDVVLANPPWGGRFGESFLNHFRQFPIRSRESTNLFMQHIMRSLRPGGRAVVAVSDGTLFRTGPDRELRKRLLEEFCVKGIVSLPEGTFAPLTGIKSSLIVFERNRPSKSVRFLTVRSLAGTKGAKKNALSAKEVAKQFTEKRESKYSWETPCEELERRDWELISKRSGDEELYRWFENVRQYSPEIEVMPLQDVAKINKGYSYEKKNTSEYDETGDWVGLVRVSDMRSNRVTQPSLFLGPGTYDSIKPTQYLEKNDILLSGSGTIGKIAVFSESDIDAKRAVPAKNIFIIRPEPSLLPEYLSILLESDIYKKWLEGHARGSTIQNLSVRMVRHLPVLVPPLMLQERIVFASEKGEKSDIVLAISEAVSRRSPARALRNKLVHTAALALDSTSETVDLAPKVSVEKAAISFLRWNDNQEREQADVEWWNDWRTEMVSALSALSNIQAIEEGPALYALLNEARFNLMEIRNSIKNVRDDIVDYDEETILDSMLSITKAINKTILAARKALLQESQLDLTIKETSLSAGVQSDITINVHNIGPLPLRNLSFSTEPGIGEARIAYLAEESKDSFSVKIPAQATSGIFEFVVKWTGQDMASDNVEDSEELAIDIQSTRQKVITEKTAELGQSPYITGGPVDRDEMFFGRTDIIKKISRQLSNTQRANVILLEGNRRCGKTSLLHYILRTNPFENWIPVYCDFQKAIGDEAKAGIPTNEIFITIALAIFRALHARDIITWIPGIEPPDAPKWIDFRRKANEAFTQEQAFPMFEAYLESALQSVAPCRLLLMLDEFGKIQEGIETGVTSPQVLANIRHLLHNRTDMCAILSYTKFLRRLREEYWSALFGLGYPIHIGSLREEEAHQLIINPIHEKLKFTEKSIAEVSRLCARQPYLVQRMCNRLFDIASDSSNRVINEDAVQKASSVEAEDNEQFLTLWKDFVNCDRQRYILCLCTEYGDGPDPINLQFLEIKMEEAGIILPEDGILGHDLEFLRDLEILDMSKGGQNYSMAIPLMSLWIRKNVDTFVQRARAKRESEEVV